MGGGAESCGTNRIGGEGSSRVTSTPGEDGSVALIGLPPLRRIVRQPGFSASLVVRARNRRGGRYALGSYTTGTATLVSCQ